MSSMPDSAFFTINESVGSFKSLNFREKAMTDKRDFIVPREYLRKFQYAI